MPSTQSGASNPAPVASSPSTQPTTAPVRNTVNSGSDAMSERAALRRSLAEKEAALEVGRNRAVEAQQDRIIRGLLDAAVNGTTSKDGNNLMRPGDKEDSHANVVTRYYAET
ncbi:hypothetical protein [Agrobacterium tumefaciens]|uniref:hypothetical protein n=1 Tax=Agrobacterium tumefaciens TaxID=358 RepID=UPI0021D39981|nr:hypothetical protein [Agrobacterium tumefaciens]UXS00604.1 hypothetical protein FY156_03440 [Agrobacterium tumefaciens]